MAVCWERHFCSSIAEESLTLIVQTYLTVRFLSNDYLRESVGSIGSRCSERGEESGSASCFNCVDHTLLWLTQVRGLSEDADEYKYIIHP